jgi:hypothetical protein
MGSAYTGMRWYPSTANKGTVKQTADMMLQLASTQKMFSRPPRSHKERRHSHKWTAYTGISPIAASDSSIQSAAFFLLSSGTLITGHSTLTAASGTLSAHSTGGGMGRSLQGFCTAENRTADPPHNKTELLQFNRQGLRPHLQGGSTLGQSHNGICIGKSRGGFFL